ncbi:ribosomal protein S18-alanine N-acetyltransferase [Aestuariirhabdus sp. Z084]|uniref:ribosomal protein S18-alanine N-acetyltransferase n=1 Tax=Aestuariirhabdus haliotis TaxID=2918751 RepID=UPI00201B42E4|nr:ribosomal protein S18-alanine N-acetyltransferase [Aestuariirhabdus haliotis]MCL6417415.1 ribosomal protein S18-alanine N-acetyltransferase [Aestuariirhabdus haliotis]MCL6421359.1 ribosomal protein S18-alanine N-acetyltransferase [Aestuariirhabdus haliotis]
MVNEKDYHFRPMEASDLDAVMAVEVRAYSHPWTRGIFAGCLKPGHSCWVIEKGSRLIGHGVLSAAAGEAHLLNITVSPETQGLGIGRHFLHHFIDIALGVKAETLFLEVRPSNLPAVHLYESIGFNEVGRRKDYYPAVEGREDGLIMAYSIAADSLWTDD